jgi:hypothetical protein
MIKCCQKEWSQVDKLPFEYPVTLGWYDGYLSGIAQCIVCKNIYYFELLTWDNETQDDRIFVFYEIKNSTIEQLIEKIHITGQSNNNDPMPFEKIIITNCTLANTYMLTNVCFSNDSLKTGTWQKAFPMKKNFI